MRVCVCVCVRAYVRACVRAYVSVCARACARGSVLFSFAPFFWGWGSFQTWGRLRQLSKAALADYKKRVVLWCCVVGHLWVTGKSLTAASSWFSGRRDANNLP